MTQPGSVMLPPSFAQELLWLTARVSPGDSSYNVPRTRKLVGPLDLDALRRAFDALAARHEILRTTYGFEGDRAVQVIHPATPVDFTVVDLSAQTNEAALAEARRLVAERAVRPFDLAQEPPLRVAVIRLGEGEHLLHIDSHHIAADGWSRDVMFRDLDALYQAAGGKAPVALPDLPIQYADFAVWQREQLSGAHLQGLLDYWRNELGDAEFVLDLPTDFPRPPRASIAGVTSSIDLPLALMEELRQLGRRHEATLYMVLLAGYTALLHRYTGRADVLVGSPVAGRAVAETEGLIGYFANTIVQRARFGGAPTFESLLRQLRGSALSAYEHQDVPFEKLVLELQSGQSLSHAPLFQVVFTMLEGAQESSRRLGDAEVLSFAGEGNNTKFDLTLFMAERPDHLTLTLRGRADLFAPETMDRMLSHLRLLLTAVIADPQRLIDAIPLRTAEEVALERTSNNTAIDLSPQTTVTSLVEAVVDRQGHATAVISGDDELSFGDMDRRANQLAHQLRLAGVIRTTPVALCLERSADVVVAMLAVLKAGGCYVPLAADAPTARLALQLNECGAGVVIAHARHLERLPESIVAICPDRDAELIARQPVARFASGSGPDDPAYVLFTSGSTGVPKGVVVSHANIVHYTRSISRVLAEVERGSPGDGLAALSGWSFGHGSSLAADLGNTALFPALCAGGVLHLLSDDVVTNPAQYAEYLSRHRIDVLKLTPNHVRALVGDRSAVDLQRVLPARWLVLGGEALSWALAAQLRSAGTCRVLNHYGPTETTVGASTWLVGDPETTPHAATVPIGGPLANVVLHVLDDARKPMPTGVPGELYIGGAGVTQGYLHRPELTAERFVALPGVGRVYRTGDRVRRLATGEIEFLGRVDNQVKVRGFRVELGEIEQVLGGLDVVDQCAVILHSPVGLDPVVAAYVVPKLEQGYAGAHAVRPTPERIQQLLANRLPDYMVPAVVVLVDALPLTANGKLDRASLPDPLLGGSTELELPATPTEEAMRQIWADALKRDATSIGVLDDFLVLGGHSLVAIRILGKISRTFGLRLPLRTLFDAPQIRQLAELIDLERKLAALEAMTDRPPTPAAGA